MKILEIHLKEFKRFKDLLITGLTDKVKLVMLVGPNGCGKSSLFDGIYSYALSKYYGLQYKDYYIRSKAQDANSVIRNNRIVFQGNMHHPDAWRKAVYVRTAYRNTSSFTINSISMVGSALQEQRVVRMIDNDSATVGNYNRLYSQTVANLFNKKYAKTFGEDIVESIIGEVRDVTRKLFSDLILNRLNAPDSGAATFYFDKGEVGAFNYENLSGGEKAAFDLILDLIIKSKEYNDTVFCIDEPEVHINPKIQGRLLRILHDLVPEGCQLWLATHSIGMMREAYNMYKESPESVVFLDFAENESGNERDFDQPQTINPAKITRGLWERIHEIVLGDLADLVAPDILCICESMPEKRFDAICYETIFATEYPLAKFVSAGSKSDVVRMPTLLSGVMPKLKVIPIRDGDQMTTEEKEDARAKGARPLSRRCIEEYLMDDEVLKAFCAEYFPGDESIFCELQQIKNACADIKKAPHEVRSCAINKNRALTIGDNGESFQKYTLSRLIKPGMRVYAELKEDIFGGL